MMIAAIILLSEWRITWLLGDLSFCYACSGSKLIKRERADVRTLLSPQPCHKLFNDAAAVARRKFRDSSVRDRRKKSASIFSRWVPFLLLTISIVQSCCLLCKSDCDGSWCKLRCLLVLALGLFCFIYEFLCIFLITKIKICRFNLKMLVWFNDIDALNCWLQWRRKIMESAMVNGIKWCVFRHSTFFLYKNRKMIRDGPRSEKTEVMEIQKELNALSADVKISAILSASSSFFLIILLYFIFSEDIY